MADKRRRRGGRPSGSAKFTRSDGKTQIPAEGYRRVTFFAPEAMTAKLKAVAAFQGIPASELLNRIIGEYLKGVKIKV